MKARLMAGVLGIVMAVSFACAEDFVTSVAPNSKAMLFTFKGLSSMEAGDFNGGIGAKYYLSSSTALRVGLEFMTASVALPANPEALLNQTGIDGSASATKFGISAAVEYHLLPTRVSPYVGGGIGISSGSTEYKNPVVNDPPPRVQIQQTTDKNFPVDTLGVTLNPGFEMNVGGIVGVEFFITKEISLSAEYQLFYSTTSFSDEEEIQGNLTQKTKMGSTSGLKISSIGGLTLAVYF